MHNKPLLTIVMPTYNSSDYIDNTVNSLISMVGTHTSLVEILFVDDGSTDDTLLKLQKYVYKYKYMKVTKSKHLGVSIARNTGIAQSEGDYVTFLDSDDTFTKNFVSYFQKIVKKYDAPEIILVNAKGIKDDKLIVNASVNDRLKIIQAMFWIGSLHVEPGIASKFFKCSFLLANQSMFDDRLVFSEDQLFNVQLFLKANSILLTSFDFYHTNESHSLMYFNKNILNGQLAFLDELKKSLYKYKDNGLAIQILNRAKQKTIYMFVDRYYGPLYINGTNSLDKSSKLLKQTIYENKLHPSLKTDEFDSIISFRYRLFRRLLKHHQYKLCLLVNKYMDFIKGYDRFKNNQRS